MLSDFGSMHRRRHQKHAYLNKIYTPYSMTIITQQRVRTTAYTQVSEKSLRTLAVVSEIDNLLEI